MTKLNSQTCSKYALGEVFPIICYKSQYKGNFYSRLANTEVITPQKELQEYFKKWLSFSLSKLPTRTGTIYHHIDKSYADGHNAIVHSFTQHIGSEVIFKKFLSTSKVPGWDCKIAFEIEQLSENSLGKDVFNVFYEESEFGEQEVLFDSDSIFRIEGIFAEENVCRIQLKEIGPQHPLPSLEFFQNSLHLRNKGHY